MIKNSEPLSMSESTEYISKDGEKGAEVMEFIKKFVKLKAKDAKELKQDIERLGIIKIKPEYTVKIIDTLPENSEELNKIFVDVGLDDDETRKILETVKRFK